MRQEDAHPRPIRGDPVFNKFRAIREERLNPRTQSRPVILDDAFQAFFDGGMAEEIAHH
jgi:hypothetical protein